MPSVCIELSSDKKKNLEQKLRKKLKRVNSYHLFVLATKSIVIFIFRLVLAGNCKYGDSAVKKKGWG